MAMSLNKVQLIGNLTRDPEMKQIPGGQTVANFGIATNLTWTKDGEKQNRAEFHNIVVWGKLAEICGQYLKKGSKAYFEGRLQTRDWEAEDGTKRYRTEVVAENMIMLDKKGDYDSSGGSVADSREPAGIKESAGSGSGLADDAGADSGKEPAAAKAGKDEEVSIDDLPF